MLSFILSVLAIVGVLILGDAVLEIEPTLPEMLLVVGAFFVGNVVEAAVKEFTG